jgi:hypothetical protein
LHERLHLLRANRNALPVGVIAARLIPADVFAAGIVGFAFEKVRFKGGAAGGFPSRTCDNFANGAIGEFQPQLGAETRVLPIGVTPSRARPGSW